MYRQTFPAPRGPSQTPYFVQGTTPDFAYTVTWDGDAPVSLSAISFKLVQEQTLEFSPGRNWRPLLRGLR